MVIENRGRGGLFGHPYRNKPFPFDLFLSSDAFPPVKQNDDDEAKMTEEVMACAESLKPTEKEYTEMSELVGKVKGVLDTIRTTTDAEYLPGVVLDEVFEVGSFKKDTMLRGHRIADIVVITKSMPTFESVASIGQKLCNELSDETGVVSMVSRDFGLIITKREDKVRILISTVQSNTAALEKDLHLCYDVIAANQASIYHARRFESFTCTNELRPIVRIFKGMIRRFPGLEPINIWALESLIQYCIISTPTGLPLSAGAAFKRVLSQLAAGIFLPGSSGLSDPVDSRYRLCDQLSYEDMDKACSTAQTLLRILCFGGIGILLGTSDKTPGDISTEAVYVNGQLITPLERAYEEPVVEKTEVDDTASSSAMETTSTA